MNFFKRLVKRFTPMTARAREYQYLANSENLCDLERRQRRIERGEVKF